MGFLDRHYVWRSHDPTPGIWSDFVKKKEKIDLPPFFSFFNGFTTTQRPTSSQMSTFKLQHFF